MTDSKPKKLFKVASEFNVATQSIVDALADQGFEIANKPNSSITVEMYSALEEVYGVEKQKSREHEKVREEYESRRNQMHTQRNESVTIDSFLEPIEDLEPVEETEPEDLPEPEKVVEEQKAAE
ncbi:MAG: translation initiation factor IF-2, partial [Balneolaceae bacterium]